MELCVGNLAPTPGSDRAAYYPPAFACSLPCDNHHHQQHGSSWGGPCDLVNDQTEGGWGPL